MGDNLQLPGLTILAVVTVIVLLILFFPAIAALVAPEGRRWTFALLTLFVLPGPIGVACAAIAQPRNPTPPNGFRTVQCGRCDARNTISGQLSDYKCWRCGQHHGVDPVVASEGKEMPIAEQVPTIRRGEDRQTEDSDSLRASRNLGR